MIKFTAILFFLLVGCGEKQTAPVPEAELLETYDSQLASTCSKLSLLNEEPVELILPGARLIFLVGQFYREGKLVTDEVVELRSCDLVIDTNGDIEVVYKCVRTLFSFCTGGAQ